MESIQGKHFSITDQKNVNTVIYQINKTKKEYLNNSPKLTIERLDFLEEFRGEKKKKTFFVDNLSKEDNQLVILSFSKEKVVVNLGLLENDRIKVCKKPVPIKFDTIYTEQEADYKEFRYTPNLKRPISIIDPETGDEIKPILYYDKETNEYKGKCRLKPYKSYFAFEIGEDKN